MGYNFREEDDGITVHGLSPYDALVNWYHRQEPDNSWQVREDYGVDGLCNPTCCNAYVGVCGCYELSDMEKWKADYLAYEIASAKWVKAAVDLQCVGTGGDD